MKRKVKNLKKGFEVLNSLQLSKIKGGDTTGSGAPDRPVGSGGRV
jgi:hypothetical protein